MLDLDIRSWLDRFDQLAEEMKKSGDRQCLMVAACMYSLRGAISMLGGADERALSQLFEAGTLTSQRILDENAALEIQEPS